jgi:hypothetical protein
VAIAAVGFDLVMVHTDGLPDAAVAPASVETTVCLPAAAAPLLLAEKASVHLVLAEDVAA